MRNSQSHGTILGYSRREFFTRTALAACALYPPLIEPFFPRIEQVTATIPNLPQEFEGLKLVQLTDIHRGQLVSQTKVYHGLKMASALRPDLLVLTGDYVTGSAHFAFEVVKEIRTLFHPPHGILAVLGNHDYWTNERVVTSAFRQFDVPLLKNESRKITRNGGDLYFVGVDDVWSGEPSLEKALVGVPKNAPKILLCHEPDYADIARHYGFPLQLSGHSHGGQVHLPFVPRIYPYLAQKYPIGMQRVEGSSMLVYTSRGIGHLFPGRIN
ncbi:MAG: metallophosphoesterase, partial [bacterium]